jgi:hypothetical protein
MIRRGARMFLVGFAGPLAWLTMLVANWSLTPGAHEAGRLPLLRAIIGGTFLICVVSAGLARREMRRLDAIESTEVVTERARFVARCALALAIMAALLAVASAIPTFLLLPGAEP